MVRFSITETELRQRIDEECTGWHSKAQAQTAKITAAGTLSRFPNLWSEIKQVYMTLQGSKCAFCEKWLEDEKIEHDVEHFRPKSRVDRWTVPAKLRKVGVVAPHAGRGSLPGYARLAYHPLNYVTACKTCNSVLKKCWFPIAGPRDSSTDHPALMSREQAFLIYPISDIDEDPEDLIAFLGISPQARATTGFHCHRALVTIQVFRLDSWRLRKELHKDRAEFLEKLYWALTQRDDPVSTRSEVNRATRAIGRLTNTLFRHANCLRSFNRVYDRTPAEAHAIYLKVSGWLKTVSR